MTLFQWHHKPRVKVEYPLKQGLKHIRRDIVDKVQELRVKVEYPLKQGLKL